MFAVVKYASGVQQLVEITPIHATDPGFGGGAGGGVDPGYGHPDWGPVDPGWGGGRPGGVDPGWGQGHPRPDRPGNALPIPPVRPSPPIVLPPGVWPPQLPPGPAIDNELPGAQPGRPSPPIVIPPGSPGIDNELPIHIPSLPPGVALLIALPQAQPKAGDPPNTKPAILVQSGKKPVLVYVSAAATPK